MTLSEYLGLEGSPSLTEMSIALEVSKGRLSQLRDATDWPPDLALKVEEYTRGAIDAAYLSPIVARARGAIAA